MAGFILLSKEYNFQLGGSPRHPQNDLIIPSTYPEPQSRSDAQMADPTKEEKVTFFREFDELTALDRLDEQEDKLDEEEQQHREKCRAFFNTRTKNTAAQSKPQTRRQPQQQSQSPIKPPRHPLLRRTASLPAAIGANTPGGPGIAQAEKSQLDVIKETPRGSNAAEEDGVSFIQETPIPETARPPATLRRSTTMPLPNLSPAAGAEQSPSACTALRKRKRQPAGSNKAIPESMQIFKGLSFYYIPNNDIARMRKLRIAKAQQFGAQWVRDLSGASHVIVDKNLSYADIERIPGFSPASSLVLVNEEYPLDCISFRTLLNPGQQRYRIVGSPIAEKPTALPDHTPVSASLESGSASLQVKEVAKPTAPESTPPADEELPVEKAPTVSEVRSSEPIPPQHPEVTSGDELSEYIELMKQYKDLPLENEDDDSCSIKSSAPEEISEVESASEDERALKRRITRSSRSLQKKKTIAFEDRFACNRGGTKDKPGQESIPNARTIEILQAMCDYYTRINDHWRTTAYRKAIATLRRQTTKIATEEEAYRLPNIGRRLAQKIEEIVTTDRLRRLDQTNSEPLDKSLEAFLNIYGVGLCKATKWVSQGYRTLQDLLAKADLTANQRIGIERYDDLNTRIPRQEVFLLGEFVKREAAALDPKIEILIGGSYRRGSDSSGDIDLIVTKPGTSSSSELVPFLEALLKVLHDKKFLVATLAALHARSRGSKEAGSKWHGCCVLPSAAVKVWRRIDFLLVPESEYGAALIYFTGNDIFNRSLRLLASKKGMRLNQRGLYKEPMRVKAV